MGYTHYWYRQHEIEEFKMQAIMEDFSKMVLHLDDLGVHLANGDGEGTPQADLEAIRFNGPVHCGHPKNSEISIPWPTPIAQGVIDGAGKAAGEWFAGATLDARCCNGDCSYETFNFPRLMDKSYLQAHSKHKKLYFECTKTAYRPYDLAVNVALVVAKHHLGSIIVNTDGELNHWREGIELCRVYLGYPEHYVFNADGELIAIAELPANPEAVECGENYERCQHRASKHFPELEGTPSGKLWMQTWLGGWKPAGMDPHNAVAFIVHGPRYEKGGHSGDSAFGSWSRWSGKTYRGRPLWVQSLKSEDLPDYPVAVKYKSGMKPYPEVQWVFAPTQNESRETLIGGAA